MWISHTIDDLRCKRRELPGPVALVPTMGALHDGHVRLVGVAGTVAASVVVSLFVNPTQFAPGEDFDKYPRTPEADLARCAAGGAAGVFAPSVAEVYPPHRLPCDVNVPALAAVLEGEHRPTHFAGVCRVVLKLFNIVQPDVAVFGQKDYQQLRVIESMVADLDLPVKILPAATVREPDGLAMSSRNRYLDGESRRKATALHKALTEARTLIEDDGETDPRAVETAMRHVLMAHGLAIDYAVVRHPQTLGELDIIEPALTHGVVALVAARVGGVRLIDNAVIGVG